MIKTVRLTQSEIIATNPPGFSLVWDETAVRQWLRQQGFDLTKEIRRYGDGSSDEIIFEQDVPDERPTKID